VESQPTNKWKIINDPVFGFLKIRSNLVFDLVEHPYFQRLRRIKQLGLTNFVYPGATHTRYQHAMGAMHLMHEAIHHLRSKSHEITPEEEEAAAIAILLHDIGHGPFSHALEYSLIHEIGHENMSALLMAFLNQEMKGKLDMAIRIFRDDYPKRFLHQLVSGQLDMDRMDYLRRDSFFTGVTEGAIGSDRLIKMLNVVNDDLVVESKGIYSIEKFLIARRLMYWQVYFHKTVISAEHLLVNILSRARALADSGQALFATPALRFFLYNRITHDNIDIENMTDPYQKDIVDHFSRLDDTDIIASAKVWMDHPDAVLRNLSRRLIDRDLFKIEIQEDPFDKKRIKRYRERVAKKYNIDDKDTTLFVFTQSISNHAYNAWDEQIKILHKDGTLLDVATASDMLGASVLSKVVTKHYLCYPKEIKE
jgi:HD superfamily phosphohydrolase